ncbi:hypothetical protein SYJ56_24230 [Algoriphagus sp. D3-2-R+10]|uniref:hypothetical protein n=1 Tax=Algoriphagus aurantiacus TaxID=3103948 RepID=UPI002B3DAC4B|nr:hypothetical protein [Algoriphagus sp. D3-2-R+10]MEB2778440.1 hypothetical protein [Algoriphagus sp. D3-2-R+10]
MPYVRDDKNSGESTNYCSGDNSNSPLSKYIVLKMDFVKGGEACPELDSGGDLEQKLHT